MEPKKKLICIIIFIVACITCFCAGRFIRIRGITEDGIRTEQQIEQLTREIEQLESELENRIAQCEQLESQLGRVESGIDESLRTARSIRDEIESGRSQLSGSNAILQELRRRFVQYENRITELENYLAELKKCANQ